MLAVEIRNLTKRYKSNIAVNQLNMNVEEGQVYGLLGRNGAGKTSTIRMILGLAKPSAGSIKVFGVNTDTDKLEANMNIGAIVETPGIYRNLSAMSNLKITADIYNKDKKRIDEVLEIVGLSDVGEKPVKHYSTGMKQRLGIANALIHSPRLLILDEPTNGLDPEGINMMREFIKKLVCKLNITVIMSSHILSEVEHVADKIGIIDKGKMVDEFEIDEGGFNKQEYIRLEVDDCELSQKIINNLNHKYKLENQYINVFCNRDENSKINRELVKNNINVFSMNSIKNSLEDRFFKAIGVNKEESYV